mmetsp:Transcript_21833/g.45573  ORF Transcript_21833/g.45573 Transcript_21833/m.45573 type:complete len:188 (+) Transcript_21833:316-879(+)
MTLPTSKNYAWKSKGIMKHFPNPLGKTRGYMPMEPSYLVAHPYGDRRWKNCAENEEGTTFVQSFLQRRNENVSRTFTPFSLNLQAQYTGEMKCSTQTAKIFKQSAVFEAVQNAVFSFLPRTKGSILRSPKYCSFMPDFLQDSRVPHVECNANKCFDTITVTCSFDCPIISSSDMPSLEANQEVKKTK